MLSQYRNMTSPLISQHTQQHKNVNTRIRQTTRLSNNVNLIETRLSTTSNAHRIRGNVIKDDSVYYTHIHNLANEPKKYENVSGTFIDESYRMMSTNDTQVLLEGNVQVTKEEDTERMIMTVSALPQKAVNNVLPEKIQNDKQLSQSSRTELIDSLPAHLSLKFNEAGNYLYHCMTTLISALKGFIMPQSTSQLTCITIPGKINAQGRITTQKNTANELTGGLNNTSNTTFTKIQQQNEPNGSHYREHAHRHRTNKKYFEPKGKFNSQKPQVFYTDIQLIMITQISSSYSEIIATQMCLSGVYRQIETLPINQTMRSITTSLNVIIMVLIECCTRRKIPLKKLHIRYTSNTDMITHNTIQDILLITKNHTWNNTLKDLVCKTTGEAVSQLLSYSIGKMATNTPKDDELMNASCAMITAITIAYAYSQNTIEHHKLRKTAHITDRQKEILATVCTAIDFEDAISKIIRYKVNTLTTYRVLTSIIPNSRQIYHHLMQLFLKGCELYKSNPTNTLTDLLQIYHNSDYKPSIQEQQQTILRQKEYLQFCANKILTFRSIINMHIREMNTNIIIDNNKQHY